MFLQVKEMAKFADKWNQNEAKMTMLLDNAEDLVGSKLKSKQVTIENPKMSNRNERMN